MTSLVCWLGVDNRAPSSLYIATDSRISWGSAARWDAARKVFASRSRPEVFGYVGDVIFPSMLLGQIADSATTCPSQPPSPEIRFGKLVTLIHDAFNTLPKSQRNNFRIVYACREGSGMRSRFCAFSVGWDAAKGWAASAEALPASSDTIVILGTGTASIRLWKERWTKTREGSTSRAIFSALCDSISRGKDPNSGGAPQLVALYRKGPARTIGIIHSGTPYFYGLPADPDDHVSNAVEWRNHLFEMCDATGVRLPSAQVHRAPKGLGETQ